MLSIKHWGRPDAATAGFIVPPGEGDRIPSKPNGKAKATSRNTGGLFAVHEAILVPGEKVVRHRHNNVAEFFYVLEGEVLLQIGDEVTKATPGTFTFSPINSVHAFSNLGTEPARMLIVATPPEPGEQAFEEMERMPADADEAAWDQLNRKYGVEVVGPPLEG